MVHAMSIGFFVTVLALGVIGARSASACVVSTTVPTVRLEGTTEFLGVLTLTCGTTVGDPIPTATPNSFITVTLTGVNFSPVALSAGAATNTSNFPPPVVTSTVPFTVAPVVTVAGRSVTFAGLTPAAAAQTITITGLRANIAAAGITPSPILAVVTGGGGLALGAGSTLVIATVSRGLGEDSGFPTLPLQIGPVILAPAGEPANVLGNPDPSTTASNSLKVTLVEGFANAFRTAASEDGGTSGVQGTRFRIVLRDIPAGIIPYAPRALRGTSLASTGALSPATALTAIRRVDAASADGSGGAVLSEVVDQFDKIAVSGGAATILYEITTDDPSVAETISLFIALTAQTALVGAGTINGSVSFAPVGPPTANPARPQFSANPTLPPPPVLSLSSTALRFTAFFGSNPAPQILLIRNSAGGVLNWTATISSITGGNWLALSPLAGEGNTFVSVTVNSAALPLGSYNAAVTVSAPGAVSSPQTVSVLLAVVPRPTLVVTPSSLDFISSPGRGDPASQTLTITALDGVLNWAVTASTVSGGNWLSVTGTSGVTPHAFVVAVKTAGLAEGTYRGAVTVAAPDATNSPRIVNVTLTVGTPGTPAISLRPSSLVFAASSGRTPPSQTFEVQNTGTGVLGWTATVSTQSGGSWLAVSPTTAVAPSVLTVSVNPSRLSAGAYTGTITIGALPGVSASNSPQVLTVGLVVDAPAVALGGVVNAASYAPEAVVSPGSIASLFGTNLAKTTATAPSTPLPTILGGAQVLVNSVPAPLFYVSPTQINFQMPLVSADTNAEIVVVSDGVRGLPASVRTTSAAPGIFTAAGSGTGQAAALLEDFSLNSAQNPIAAGRVLQIFATGLGATNPVIAVGQPASASPLSVTVSAPVVLIGGNPAEVLFSGLAPGLVGANQINVRVPAGTPPGNTVPVQVQAAGRTSNTATIAVR